LVNFIKVFVPLFLLLGTIAVLAYQYHKNELYQENIKSRQNSLLFKENFIKDFMSSAIDDIFYLGNSNIPSRIVSYRAPGSAAIKDLTLFAQTAHRYDQLRILDVNGLELVRINYVNEKAVLLSSDRLQDKSGRHYFKEAQRLEPGQVYISPIDLNEEHGEVEIPYKPEVRLLMRIDVHGKLAGYLVVNVLLTDFFEELKRSYTGPGTKFMFLNSQGYWLVAPSGYTAFGFMFGEKKNERFPEKFPEEWKAMAHWDTGYLKTENGLFVFSRVRFRSFVEGFPYLSGKLLLSAGLNDFVLLFFVPSSALRSAINKDLPYLFTALVFIAASSTLFAFFRANALHNDYMAKEQLLENQRKLLQLVSQLSVSNTQLREFSQIVSHNLRAPVANLNVLTELLSSTNEVREEEKVCDKLKTVSASINSLMDDLVKTVKVLNAQNLEMKMCRLDETVNKIKIVLNEDITSTNATINTDFSTWNEIEYPAAYFESIIQTLLANAIKFRELGRPLVIGLKSFYLDQYKVFSVSDNGVGINLDRHKDSIFKLHKRFHRDRPGGGLGLFMAKTQVESLGGRITVESREGEGAIFTIYFTKME